MRAYVHILARLMVNWGHLPPEVISTIVFALPVLVGLLAGLPYVLDLVAGGLVSWWCAGIFREHVWPDVPPEHRRALVALRDKALMRHPDRKPLPRHHRGEGDQMGTMKETTGKGAQMADAHEAAKYVENMTSLADDVHVTSERYGSRVTLKGVRKRADGSEIEVTIEIRDNGPGAGDHRYEVDVSADGVETIRANPSGSLTDALSNADAHSSGLG